MTYYDEIAQVIADRTGYDVASVEPDSTFEEFGIDSLDTVELLMSLEDVLGFQIELDQTVGTVRELDEFIQSRQG